MQKNTFKRFIILYLVLIAHTAPGQVLLSPFTIGGIGQLQPDQFVSRQGMGGVSVAAMGDNEYSLNNPATYSDVKSNLFETGLYIKLYEEQTTAPSDQLFRNKDYQIPYFSFAVPLNIRQEWGLGFGLYSVSRIGYDISTTTNDTFRHTDQYNGTGGFSKFYIGTSKRIFKNFYLGGNAAYFFGNETIAHTIDFPDTNSLLRIDKQSLYDVGKIVFSAGLLWRDTIRFTHFVKRRLDDSAHTIVKEKKTNKIIVQIGGSTDFASKLNTTEYLNGFNYYTDSTAIGDSTLRASKKGFIYLPASYNFGVQVSKGRKWTIGADINYTQWSKYRSFDSTNNLADFATFHIGAQWVADTGLIISKLNFWEFIQKISYRVGFQYGQPINAPQSIYQPIVKSASIGFGIPIPNRGARFNSQYSMVNFSIEVGQLGSLQDIQVRERYIRFALGFHLYDLGWFNRPKIE